MSGSEKFEKDAAQTAALDELDPVMKQALGDFKSSVHAWSDAAMSRPRTVAHTAVRHGWRFAVAWAMGAVLLVGGISGGAYVHHRDEVAKQIALQQEKEAQQRQIAQQREQQEEKLLANVDSDISRQVPEAMEPLAQLMNEYDAQ